MWPRRMLVTSPRSRLVSAALCQVPCPSCLHHRKSVAPFLCIKPYWKQVEQVDDVSVFLQFLVSVHEYISRALPSCDPAAAFVSDALLAHLLAAVRRCQAIRCQAQPAGHPRSDASWRLQHPSGHCQHTRSSSPCRQHSFLHCRMSSLKLVLQILM